MLKLEQDKVVTLLGEASVRDFQY